MHFFTGSLAVFRRVQNPLDRKKSVSSCVIRVGIVAPYRNLWINAPYAAH